MKGEVGLPQTEYRAQFLFLAYIQTCELKFFIHRLALTVVYLSYRRKFLKGIVEENFDAELTEKFRATHRKTIIFDSLADLSLILLFQTVHSPPFEIYHVGKSVFRAYLFRDSQFVGEKSRLFCSRRLCGNLL